MISRLLAIALSLLLFQPQTATAAELSAKELKKVLRQADKAYAAGQGEQAVELYERVLAATPTGDSRRGDALYAVAMARLSPEGPERDAEAAKRHLDELATSFERHPRRLEITAVRQLLGELDAVEAEIARRDAEREERLAAIEAEREAVADAGGEVKSLQAQLRKMRAKLAETQSELAGKEEALQKLKDALVRRAGGGS